MSALLTGFVPKNRRILLNAGVAAAVLVTAGNSFFMVDPAHMAGTRLFGGTPMETAPLRTGVHFKIPFVETVDQLQTSRSLFTIDDMEIHTVDNQTVQLSISVLYQIPPAAVLPLLYNTGAAGDVDIDGTITSTIRSAALITFAGYNTTSISGSLGQISDRLQSAIGESLKARYGIDVIQVNLGNIQYSQQFSDAVEAAVQSKANAVAAQNTVLQKTYEGQQRVVSAQADAQAAIAAANGSAQAVLINAEAQAKAISELGQALQANPQYVRYLEATRWNGALPGVTGGAIPLIDLGDAQEK